MANKALSTGTLSLRFMQNAQRAKQQKEVEVERAQVEDEAEWHVSQAVKDAWGAAASTSTKVVVEQESSYLPFLFPSNTSDVNEPSETDSRPRGRRKFDKKGEVVEQPAVIQSTVPEPPVQERTTVKKLHSISSFGAGSSKKKTAAAISAKQTIFEITGVDKDLRSRPNDDPSSDTPPTLEKPSGFLKPVGIDAPTHLPSTGTKRDRVNTEDEKKARKKKKRKSADATDES